MNKKEIEKEIKEEFEKLKKEVENKSLYYPKEGEFDNKKRWYPNEEEDCSCCIGIRSPSAAWPFTLLKHCDTEKHQKEKIRKKIIFRELKKAIEQANVDKDKNIIYFKDILEYIRQWGRAYTEYCQILEGVKNFQKVADRNIYFICDIYQNRKSHYALIIENNEYKIERLKFID